MITHIVCPMRKTVLANADRLNTSTIIEKSFLMSMFFFDFLLSTLNNSEVVPNAFEVFLCRIWREHARTPRSISYFPHLSAMTTRIIAYAVSVCVDAKP